ncbi:hypothetical protein LTR91_010498 [Friedmanniomyces endolithicus]|uniref:Cysteine dioxygenase n=1 Tax=Friedmanniomyces endolithicus TaxID=329885 RepID=A0AAN6JA59_9PEZI|nr:hypothetical protein LTS09_011051 [Friedmanniomyces endolithicus]KAK0284647.1 hypothetical protein LTR35_005560 [Friedmanniomyces endolithicus]KAK0297589.1 hypothetical protein LTS00_003721 [Friedmanniomyces endolithicus]KAK0312606.1 hypothetical protein LTR01_002265 [Friedmanniomyces endolithicus]KAK0322063.1 hypothetical protein LTR82_007037 [Friedmanniomyces endolithicus]
MAAKKTTINTLLSSDMSNDTTAHHSPTSLHDSARGSPEPPLDSFHTLVQAINKILGPCNGIDSAGVDVEELKSAMRAFDGPDEEWQKYAFQDYSRPYTRNLVDRGNGKSNLLILVWTPGKASPIHDHANAHCVMRILKGSLTETIYGWPCEGADGLTDCATSPTHPTGHTCSAEPEQLEPHALCVKRSTCYERGQVTYMSDRLGLHRIQNANTEEVAVSLHLYTPPNAARHGCHIFDQRTGKKSKVQQCHFYSELGVKME